MITNEFKPLPQAALEKLIEDGSYVFSGKHDDYFVSFCDADEGDENFGKLFVSDCHGDEVFTVKPEAITFKGGWIKLVDEDGYVRSFTLEKRETTHIEDIAQELIG